MEVGQEMTQLITKDDEIREQHRKRLYELSLKSIGEIPQLEEPSYEQKEWFVHKMKVARAWNTCIDHKTWIFRWHYFVLGDYQ